MVNQRRKEIGIRVALGASNRNVVGMILGQSMRLALLGTALGAAATLAVAPVFAHEIDTLRPFEPLPYAVAAALVLTAAASPPSFRPVVLRASTPPPLREPIERPEQRDGTVLTDYSHWRNKQISS